MSYELRIKRIYETLSPQDGQRILVDRVWPRGIKKADAVLTDWLRDLAPSKELRQWFGHQPERWAIFRDRYRDELGNHPEQLRELMARCRESTVTLLYAAKDETHNNAVVLREVLLEELAEENLPGEPSSPVCYGTGNDWKNGQ